MKAYDMGEKRRRILGDGCGCHEPALARKVASRMAREAQKPPDGVDPIVLSAGKGSKCRPFLKVEKDADKFAACNALADEIGPLDTPKRAFKLIGEAIGDEVNEVFGLVTLDLHCRMKSVAETERGEATAVMAPMVPTLQAALIDGAHAVILFHVHPSGIEAEPSDADKETTKAFVKAFETVNVILLDHIIVGGDSKKRSYYSFAESNAL
jgi:DNA repair protein RadC